MSRPAPLVALALFLSAGSLPAQPPALPPPRPADRHPRDGLSGIDRAAVPPRGDHARPPDWRERTARRKADTAPNEEEKRLLKALETPVDARFKNTRLEDAVNSISKAMGLPVVFDATALGEQQLTYDSPVNFAVKKPVAARTALRGLLGGLGLTYVVREGVVFVTSPQRAREFLVTKVYSVADLVVPIDFWQFGGEAFNVAALIDLIVTTIDPESWEQRGGLGSIRYHPPTRALIVRQSAEVHARVKRGLAR
jgi:hypothetical protein